MTEKQALKAAPNAAAPRDPTTKLEKVLSKDTTIYSENTSIDHLLPFSSRERESPDQSYKGSVIFMDHASSFVFV